MHSDGVRHRVIFWLKEGLVIFSYTVIPSPPRCNLINKVERAGLLDVNDLIDRILLGLDNPHSVF